MAVDPPPGQLDADGPHKEADKNVNQEGIKNIGGNVAGINYGTIQGAKFTVNIAIKQTKDLDTVLNNFIPKVQATTKILELKFKTKGISKILTDIKELIPTEATRDDVQDRKKNVLDHITGKDSKEPKVLKLVGFGKLMEACNECSDVFRTIFRDITRPNAESIPEETFYLFGLQVEQQQFNLQMNLHLFHVYLDKDYSIDMKKMIFELAISLRAVVLRLAEAPLLQSAPSYTQFRPPAQVSGPFPALRPINFADLSRLVPLYIGWQIRKAKPSDFPPDSKFALSYSPSWARIVRKSMPFSSDELFLKVLAQVSRRARNNRNLQDEYNALQSRNQKRQITRLIKDKNEELPNGLVEWRLAGLECRIRNIGFWRKETTRIKIILKTQWVPGIMRAGGAVVESDRGGIRLGITDLGGIPGAGRVPPHPDPPGPQGGGGSFSYPQQYPGRHQGDLGQEFRPQERDHVRTGHVHNHRRQYSPPRPASIPHGIRPPPHGEPVIQVPSHQPPPSPGYGYKPPPNISIPAPQAHYIPSQPVPLPPPPPPPHVRISSSQNYRYRRPPQPPPPPPPGRRTPHPAPPAVPLFESQESALRTVRSEVTPREEELIVDSLLSEWKLPKADRKGKRREGRLSSPRNTSYGRDWALGRDISQRDSYLSREYRSRSASRQGPSFLHSTSHPPRSAFVQPVTRSSAGSGLYPERDRYRWSYHSDPGEGSGYSSGSDIEVRQRTRNRERGSPGIVVESRGRPSSGRPGRYTDTRTPRYDEPDSDERPRHNRREREVGSFPERQHNVGSFRNMNHFAHNPRSHSSDRASINDEVDEYIVVDRRGGVQRSGEDILSEERPRRRDEHVVRRAGSARTRANDISSEERPRRRSDRTMLVIREPSRRADERWRDENVEDESEYYQS